MPMLFLKFGQGFFTRNAPKDAEYIKVCGAVGSNFEFRHPIFTLKGYNFKKSGKAK
jgi:hypothetical protein